MRTSSQVIKKLTEYMPEFKTRIEPIKVEDIKPNEHNPRKKFGQEEADELVESIDSKGVLQPIIVYEKKEEGKKIYILLDGQRRYEACKKLNKKFIPAHILEKEPTFLENLSLMFHIHNVHEEWTELAIVKTLVKIIKEMGINKNWITTEEKQILQKLTSLSKYKLKKYLDILRFSTPVIDKFMEAELKEKPDLDIDLLTELKQPIYRLKNILPKVANNFPEEKFVDVIIEKKKAKIITTNKQIRKLSKIISNVNNYKINKEVATEKILYFLENKNVTIEEIYSDTSEAIEQTKEIIKISEKLRREIENIDLRKITEQDKKNLSAELKRLIDTIERRI